MQWSHVDQVWHSILDVRPGHIDYWNKNKTVPNSKEGGPSQLHAENEVFLVSSSFAC